MSELSSETEALLDRGRDALSLSPTQRARMKNAILAQGAVAVVGTAVGAAAASTGAKTALAIKLAVLTAVLGAAGASVMALKHHDEAPRVEAQARSVNTKVGEGAPSPAAPSPAATPSAPGARAAEVGSSTTTAALSAASPAAPSAASVRRVAVTPGEMTSGSSSRASAPPAIASPPAIALAPSTSATPPVVAAGRPSPLEEEARLLRAADRALKDGDAAAALRILGEHAARFPRSALEPERSAERVFALCSAGRIEDARAAAQSFLRGDRPALLVARVRSSCGGQP